MHYDDKGIISSEIPKQATVPRKLLEVILAYYGLELHGSGI